MPVLLLMTLKTGALFLLTLGCFRLMGYRSLGDMEPLDYVIVLGIGEIMGSPLSAPEDPIYGAAIAIVTLTLLQMILSALYSKIPKLGRNRIDTDSIMEELRIKGCRDERDVDAAYLEPSGRFSVILKNEASPITPRYLGESASLLLVEHGEIRTADWERCDAPKEDILRFLEGEKIESWQEIETLLYKNGTFYMERKKNP